MTNYSRYDLEEENDRYYRATNVWRTVKLRDGSEMRMRIVKNRRNIAKEITEDVFGDCDI